jgi:hypothetical protein
VAGCYSPGRGERLIEFGGCVINPSARGAERMWNRHNRSSCRIFSVQQGHILLSSARMEIVVCAQRRIGLTAVMAHPSEPGHGAVRRGGGRRPRVNGAMGLHLVVA